MASYCTKYVFIYLKHVLMCNRLSRGASPHSVDLDGNTPLHCVLHSNYDSGPETKRNIARLLLNFGADPRTQNTNERNNALHTLLQNAACSEMDLWLAFYICEYLPNSAAISSLLQAKNADGLTPYGVPLMIFLSTFYLFTCTC